MSYKLSLKELKLFSLNKKRGHDKSLQICKRLLKDESNKLFSMFIGVWQEKSSKCC